MHGFDVLEALYLYYETHDPWVPWVRGSDPCVRPIWPIVKIHKLLFKFFCIVTVMGDSLNALLLCPHCPLFKS